MGMNQSGSACFRAILKASASLIRSNLDTVYGWKSQIEASQGLKKSEQKNTFLLPTVGLAASRLSAIAPVLLFILTLCVFSANATMPTNLLKTPAKFAGTFLLINIK
ncbi:E3 11.5K [bottlenose dolphin adenovirus 2]|uniref:E3 11.5K n=1 Tax=bottlenose dolphin adenovirus 2 TaxID=2849592 RepID=A0A0M3T9H4_9ADEN|nr:E3 11.5K [Bottlenose dolphin adenovirus 1]ALE15312.1 E3 11.5K [Bottlenose dolphin adenovirus 1]